MPEALPYQGIDTWETSAILAAMNDEDRNVPVAVGAAIPQVALLVDAMVEALRRGGGIHYAAAGTSGRVDIPSSLR